MRGEQSTRDCGNRYPKRVSAPLTTYQIEGDMTELEKIMTDCRKAADYYDERPGHVHLVHVRDIYRTIARLAEVVEKQQHAIAAAAGAAGSRGPYR
jgi:hypothetical protein